MMMCTIIRFFTVRDALVAADTVSMVQLGVVTPWL